MSSLNCCFLTHIQVSQEAAQVILYSHLFQNCPQFIVIHTVKGFGIVRVRFKFAADKCKNLVRLIYLCLIFIIDLVFKLQIFDYCVVFVLLFSEYKFPV